MFGQALGTDRSTARRRFVARAIGRTALLGSVCALALAPSSVADPSGGVVVGGQAAITGQDTNATVVDQGSQRAIINWNEFSVASDGSVAFNQPNASAIALNRVVGENPSDILGQVTANGRIVIVNPNGVLFGEDAQIDVGGLIATTHDITNENFMAGNLVFDQSSGSEGYVVNEGAISVADAGLAAFVAPHVRNSGVITANLGTVELGGATAFTVDFYGDNLITFPVGSEVTSAPVGPDGAPARALVVNDGDIIAQGGAILMTASAARGVIDDVILAGGDMVATSFTAEGGSIVLSGGDAGDVIVDGTLDARGATQGGAISIDGDWVSVGGSLDASGAQGGAVDITAGGLSLAGDVRATGTTGAGGAVDIAVARTSVELASASIDVSGATGGSIRNVAGQQITTSASYDASGSAGQGGQVDVSAAALKLLSADIDASGATAGGRVRLGGEFQGGAGLSADELPNAAVLASSTGTNIDVSASGAGGAGGQVIVWSDADTLFQGAVDARPGVGGFGGFIEVSSGGVLNFNADLQTGGGQVLLDPKNLTIVPDSFSQLALILGYNYANTPAGLTADLTANDLFGAAVSLDGTRLAVGAPTVSEPPSEVGNGAVYLFTFSDDAFSNPVLAGIVGDGYTGGGNVNVDLYNGGRFGSAVSLDGNRLAVGAPGFGTAGSNTPSGAGAVLLFSFTNSQFSGGQLEGTIGRGYTGPKDINFSNSDGTEFGAAVSLDGNRLVVGAPGDDGFVFTENAGAVQLFTFTDSTFGGGAHVASIGSGYGALGGANRSIGNLQIGDRFGSAVSLDGALLAIGAADDSGADNLTFGAGAVYLVSFDDALGFSGGDLEGIIGRGYTGGNNINIAGLAELDHFGNAASLDDGRLAVGALLGDGFGNAVEDSGEVYLFSFAGPNFANGVHTGTMGAGYTGAGDFNVNLAIHDIFGSAVSYDGDRLAIGAFGDDGSGNAVSASGAVYLFTLGQPSASLATFANNPGGDSSITVSTLLALLNAGNSVVLQANNDITVSTDIIVNNPSGDGGTLILQAGRSIFLNNSIFTDNGSISASANTLASFGVVNAHRDPGAGQLVLANGASINAGTGLVTLQVMSGDGLSDSTSGDITINGQITAGLMQIFNSGATAGSDVVLGPNALLTASGSGWATRITSANGTFTNNAGPGAFAFTGGGYYGIWADDPSAALEGVSGYQKRYNVGSESAFNNLAFAAGQNFIGYRVAPVIAITADGQTKVYGNADPSLTFDANGFIDGDLEAAMLSGALSRASGEDVGLYGILQGSLGLSAAAANLGYTLAPYTGANLAITPRAITVTAGPQTKVYGEADPTLGYSITTGSLAFSDTLSGDLTRASGENVGSYAIQQGTLAASANYDLTYVGDNLAITPRGITITAGPQSKIYGELDPSLTYAITTGSLAFSDTLTGDLTRVAGENVGSYAIQQGTLAANSNYNVSYVGNNLAITPRGITVTAGPQSKIYGEVDPSLTYAITSGSLAFSDALSGDLTRVSGENVGSYAIQQGTLAANSNYDLTYVGNNLAITPRGITITAGPQSKIYGEADPSLTYAITSGSLAFSDTLSGGLIRVSGENVGSYAIQQGTLAANANYDLTYVGDNLAITARPITVTADSFTRTYGQADPLLTYALTSGNLVGGDTLSGALVRAPGQNVGSYAIQQGSLTAGSNYALTYVGGTLTINPASLVIAVGNGTRTYGDANPAFSVTYNGLTNGDSSSVVSGLTLSTTGTQSANVGSYAVTGSGASAQNYTISYTPGTLTVTPASLTITPNNASRVYGDANPTFSATFSGFKLGQNQSVLSGLTFSTAASQSSNVGTYAIMASGAASPNYTISYGPMGLLTINPASLTVSVNDASRIQGEPNPTFSATITGLKLGQDGSVVSGLQFATPATTASPPGTYVVTSSGGVAANYVITQRNDGRLFVRFGDGQQPELQQVQNDFEAGAPLIDLGGPADGDSAAFVFAGATGAVGEGDAATDADTSTSLICVLADERECPAVDGGAE